MIKSKNWLKLTLSTSILLNILSYTTTSYAQQEHNVHAQHNMDMVMPQVDDNLLATDMMPKGQPLQALPLLVNHSDKKGVFKTTLMIMPKSLSLIPNKQTTLWLYNGELLPVFDVMAGDTLDVTIQNHLPEPTTIHWHGLPVSPAVDGNPQHPIKSGDSRHITFTLPKNFSGSYWFHPHPHEFTAQQVYKGLAGLFIVRDPNDPLKAIPEQNLFFSDLKLTTDGQIANNSMLDWMNGREGQFQLLNGQYQPVISLDGTQRWRIWNGNSGRYLNLSFPPEQVEAFQVASDGGLLEKPQAITTLLLSPAERAEVVLTPKKQGDFTLTALAYERGKMGNVPKEQDLPLAQVKMQLKDKIALPSQLTTIADPAEVKAKQTIEFTEVTNPHSPAGVDFLVNGKKHDLDRVDIVAKEGEGQEWEIFNNSHMDHSFHLHGVQFQVTAHELNGQVTKPAFKMLKDTINLKPYEKVKIVFVEYGKGLRMYHCHILEHETLGMMGQLKVE